MVELVSELGGAIAAGSSVVLLYLADRTGRTRPFGERRVVSRVEALARQDAPGFGERPVR